MKMPLPELFIGMHNSENIRHLSMHVAPISNLQVSRMKTHNHFLQKQGFLALHALGITFKVIMTTQYHLTYLWII